MAQSQPHQNAIATEFSNFLQFGNLQSSETFKSLASNDFSMLIFLYESLKQCLPNLKVLKRIFL